MQEASTRPPRRGRHRRSVRVLAGLVILGLIALVLWWRLWPDQPRAAPDDPEQVALGRAVYAEHCASCHGSRLEGQPNWRERLPNGRLPAPPHDETGHTWHHPDAMLFAITKHGPRPPYAPEGYESDMPGFADRLTDAEIWAVLAYIKSTWPSQIRERHRQISEQAW
jgi:mono/diheme cytochrome c family protein